MKSDSVRNKMPKQSSKPATVLLSGGMDSSVLLHYLVKRLGRRPIYALSFRYGQKHAKEVISARRQVAACGDAIQEHLVIDLDVFRQLAAGSSVLMGDGSAVPGLEDIVESERDQPPTYVPNRNMILLSLAAAFAESRHCRVIYYGAQRHDKYGYWDCSPEFIQHLNTVLRLNRRRPIEIRAPLISMRKSEEIRLGLELGVDFAATWSCYRGEEQPCGVCPTCVERRIAFLDAGIDDPIPSIRIRESGNSQVSNS